MKTLFLDFDGVLHPSITTDFFVKSELLQTALEGKKIQIVISSSWRFQYSLGEIRQFLGQEIGSRVIDTTGDAYIGKYARYEEIKKWVDSHQCIDWAILDDSRFEFPENLSNLILCDSRSGITEKVVDRLNSWLAMDQRFI